MTTTLNETLALPCGQVLPNRVAKSAMSERLGTATGAPSLGHLRLYQRWAEGGAGLLVTGNVMIDAGALGEQGNVVVQDDSDLAGLARWAAVAHAGGAKIWAQLNHPGRQSPRNLSREPVAPSAVKLEGMFGAFAPPRALSAAEIEALVRRFAAAARVFADAGFDGVQLHAAHGYLISQFLSPRVNLRDDDWGGDDTRRRRFLLEILRAVRAAVPASFAVGVKLNSADFQRGGFDEAASMAVIDALAGEGVDLVEISGGTYEASVMFGTKPPGRRARRRSRRRRRPRAAVLRRARHRPARAPRRRGGGLPPRPRRRATRSAGRRPRGVVSAPARPHGAGQRARRRHLALACVARLFARPRALRADHGRGRRRRRGRRGRRARRAGQLARQVRAGGDSAPVAARPLHAVDARSAPHGVRS
jgi:2,4-dienoyl-CoA reductase-like NADH-dependent reductase (Old Yellow Enzyme family)